MFCTKCGKEIDYEADVCNECAAETAVAEEVVEAPAVQETVITAETVEEAIAAKEAVKEDAPEVFDKMHNFKPSLVNTIVSYLAGFFMSLCSSGLMGTIFDSLGRGYIPSVPFAQLIPVWIGGVAFGIVSLVFLVKSIPVLKDTIAYKNKHGKTPVAPFILSIVSVVLSASALFSCVMFELSAFLFMIANLLNG